MSGNIAKQATEANDALNIKNPELGWIMGFLFLVSFVGLFALVPMRKVDASPSLPTASCYLHIQYAKINLLWFVNWNICLVADYDCGLQADIPEWHRDCLPYQWIPHTAGC